MDAYQATRVVFSRIQSLDPENAAKVMGFLLIQDHSEKEMTRLAFGPEALLHSVVVKARGELGLPLPAAGSAPFPSPLDRQGSSARFLGGGAPLSVSLPASWPPPSGFSGSNLGSAADEHQTSEELVSPSNPAASPFYGGGGEGVDLVDELQLHDKFSFLNDGGAAPVHGLPLGPKRDFLYQDVDGNCRSPGGNGENAPLFPYSAGWGAAAGHHRRSCSAADVYLGSDTAGVGWKPCLYFARGYCKNGSSCRFLHGFPDDSAAAVASGNKMDAAIELQCQEMLLKSKSPRQIMASAFPYTPRGSVPASPSGANKGVDLLLQLQNENQRAMAAATATALMLGSDEGHKFMGRPWMIERSDFGAGMVNPVSRQIYLTFPADSTFREEDVSNYFSIYGPVQDVRIPYQQKRMFGFVTFVFPETVKLILSKGNPHFVCNARVLVKPYKEKGKIPDKKQQQPPPQCERVDFPACTTPTGLDSRDPFDFTQLGPRMLYNGGGISQEALLKRKLEEQQQAAELQQAIELQNRRFMGLRLLDVKNRNHFNSSISIPREESKPEDKNLNSVKAEPLQKLAEEPAASTGDSNDKAESRAAEENSKDDAGIQQSTSEHNLPDSPFAGDEDAFFPSLPAEENLLDGGKSSGLISSPALFPAADVPSFNGYFFQLPRLSSDHGAVGM